MLPISSVRAHSISFSTIQNPALLLVEFPTTYYIQRAREIGILVGASRKDKSLESSETSGNQKSSPGLWQLGWPRHTLRTLGLPQVTHQKVGYDLNTAEPCQQQGVKFLLLVAETTGAGEPQAAKLLLRLAQATAAREGAHAPSLRAQIMQELSATIRGSRARAYLCRRAERAGPAKLAQQLPCCCCCCPELRGATAVVCSGWL